MHLILAVETAKEYHKDFFESLNKKLYAYEGKNRKGFNRPHVSEIKFYDIRIKKECAPLLLRDLKAINPAGTDDVSLRMINVATRKNGFKKWLMGIGFRFIRKVMGLSDCKKADGPRQRIMKNWCYSWLLGAYKDDRYDRGFEEEL